MLSLVPILLGAVLAVGVAYALGKLWLRALAAPVEIVLAVGAPLLSLAVFLLLCAGRAGRLSFALVAAAALAAQWRARRTNGKDPAAEPLDAVMRALVAAVLGVYGVFYAVHALAPEIQADAIAYHLGLVSEYLRRGAFSPRITFYGMLPQGVEMLFVFACAFGRYSAAKLVSFCFLLATLMLLPRIARRLGLPDAAGWLAAALYFCAPVTGVTGTSSYNDAALVFFALATFYLLLAWDSGRDPRYLAAAGLTAGFCYAVKFSGIVVPAGAALFLLWRRAPRKCWLLLPGAAITILPWLARSWILTGDPVAPLLNQFFPNPYFHLSTERSLGAWLRTYGGVRWWQTPYELALGGHLQGIFGPLLFLVPLGLPALRSRAGRRCWLAAAVLGVPWLGNIGARFLMPAFPFLALALAAALPRRARWACLVLQAVACWPALLAAYTPPHTWMLEGLPLRAALRLEPEPAYLADRPEYRVAHLIEAHTPPGATVFSLMSVAGAYEDREVLEYWHNALGDTLSDALRVATVYHDAAYYRLSAAWTPRPLLGVSLRLPRSYPREWSVHEVLFYLRDERIKASPGWLLRSWPNRWEAPFALDGNLATRWRSWELARAGMYLEVDFDRPVALSRVEMLSPDPDALEIYGQALDSRWQLITIRPQVRSWPLEDLRRAAVHAIRNAGFRYVLAPTAEGEGNGPLGRLMREDPAGWGLQVAGEIGGVYLFRIE